MYDEDLVEDSLAFAKKIKEMLDKQQAGETEKSDSAQPASVLLPPNTPVSGVNGSVAGGEVRPAQKVLPQPPTQQRPVQHVQPQPIQQQPVQKAQPQPIQQRPVQKDLSVADEAIIKLREMRQATEGAQREKQDISGRAGAEGQTPAQTPAAAPAPEIRTNQVPVPDVPENNDKHTYEITIKFDFGFIKNLFQKVKEKFAPEHRTMEDVHAAMEENRRLMEERENEGIAPSGEGASILEKAKGAVKNLPGKARQEAVPAQSAEDGEAVDAEIKLLDHPGGEGKLAAKLEDVKEGLPEKVSFVSRLVTNLLILAVCVGIAYFFASFVTSYVAHHTTVEGESMEPTLSDGDNVIIQRLSYYFKDPTRYDVVVFPVSYDETLGKRTYYIKRVIGLPGETVQIIDGSVYINGNPLQDDKYALSDILEAGVAAEPLVLGEKQYFVMGDNRNMSTDSRNSYVGLVNRDDIVGEAWICVWPFSHFGRLKR